MARRFSGNALGVKLMESGICPPNARNVELHIPASGALMLRYEVFVDVDDLPKIARALEALAAEQVAAL